MKDLLDKLRVASYILGENIAGIIVYTSVITFVAFLLLGHLK